MVEGLCLLLLALWAPAATGGAVLQPHEALRGRRSLEEVAAPAPAPVVPNSDCLFTDGAYQWYIVANITVWPAALPGGAALAPSALAAAAGTQALSAINGFPPEQLGRISLVGLQPQVPGTDTVQVGAARALGFLDLLTAEQERNMFVKLARWPSNATYNNPLSSNWTVVLGKATVDTYGITDVPEGTALGNASTANITLVLCLPNYFSNVVPQVAADNVRALDCLSCTGAANSTAAQQCAAQNGTYMNSWWLMANLTITPTANATALVTDGKLDGLDVLYRNLGIKTLVNSAYANLSLLSPQDRYTIPILVQTYFYKMGGPTPGIVYSYARELLGPLTSAELASLPGQQFALTLATAPGGGVPPDAIVSMAMDPSNASGIVVAQGIFSAPMQSQCLPSQYSQAAAIAWQKSAAASPSPPPASPSPPPPVKEKGSHFKRVAVILSVVVASALFGGVAAWWVLRRRGRRATAAAAAAAAGDDSCSCDAKPLPEGLDRGSKANGSAEEGASGADVDYQSLLSELGGVASSAQYVIPYAEIQIQKRLGEGSYGSVWLGRWRETQVAVKLFLQRQGEGYMPPGAAAPQVSPSFKRLNADVAAALVKEAGIMAALRHPNCVLYVGMCVDPPALVMEYCMRGSLHEVIAAGEAQRLLRADWARRLSLAFGAAKGMLYLHSCTPPVLHRDLKSANLLVTRNWHVKVADFNLSRVQDRTCAAQASSTGGGGNPRWLAPEVLGGAPATPASDVLSFGVVMWELLALRLPWDDLEQWAIVGAVTAGRRPPVPPPEACPGFSSYQAYVELMQRCWAQAQAERLGFEEVCARLRQLTSAETRLYSMRIKELKESRKENSSFSMQEPSSHAEVPTPHAR